MKTHLVKERNAMTSAITSVWCDDGWWLDDATTDDPSTCTCESCLRECAELGAKAAKRLVNINYAKHHGFDIAELEKP